MVFVQGILIIEIVGIDVISIGHASVFGKQIRFEDDLLGGFPVDVVQLGTAAQLLNKIYFS